MTQPHEEPPSSFDADDRASDDPAPRRSTGGLSDWMDALRDVAPYLDLGWRVAGAAAFPPIAGWGVDWGLGTAPWGLLIGAGLGLVAAVAQLRQVAEEMDRRGGASSGDASA